ncbi:DUF3108 domain-containing protein [Marilutibacter chinensis]|uniref:DUF3108 domain-containing protein n=1 Tax=Marilutibacter chinensis TaxID=2912247 RepID=A0ABS9HVU9_9GAMM|nr:DUF3108 domain-containing protein [Lysobacter chinensis]MCF7222465.1 DUF3108 domain-containing protein [Lysobacter chinensis]
MPRFSARFAVTMLAVALTAVTATARTAEPVMTDAAPAAASTLAIEPAPALEPFIARYQVLNGGHALGEATLQVVELGAPRWRVDLTMGGRGLFKLAGINAEQSTVFEDTASGFLPLSQATVRKTLFTRKRSTGSYDWRTRQARWTGDIKDWRQRPVPLQPGDMSGLLINLAVIRDAEPGKTLHYRYVDNGRARPHAYQVAGELEGVAVGELSYNAMRVTRLPIDDGTPDNEETVIWVVKGVPTPVRMLQREDGEDTYDLRLVDYGTAE